MFWKSKHTIPAILQCEKANFVCAKVPATVHVCVKDVTVYCVSNIVHVCEWKTELCIVYQIQCMCVCNKPIRKNRLEKAIMCCTKPPFAN